MIILLLATILGAGSLLTRKATADFANKELSRSVAFGCFEYARLKLAGDSNYAGNATTTISGYPCHLHAIQISGANKIIKTHAQISGATTNLQFTVNGSTLSTVLLEEFVKF